ncbi:MAG TPA: metallopeptidase TldD-related protein, partial [Terriglobia bacterium]|nr:metallopeptidase TldD-related protein [Terriglobia bacterium]
EVRVGDYNLDNTHQIRGQRGGGGEQALSRPGSVLMPLDDDLDALKSVIWLETDRRYKSAVERFINVQANRAIRVEEVDSSGDLTREKAEKSSSVTLKDASIDAEGWEKKLKTYSAMFKGFPEVFSGQARMTLSVNHQYFVNSEGTSVRHGTIQYRIFLTGRTQAEDGMEFQRFESFDAHTLEGLPSDETVRKTVDKIVKDLQALRKAPVIEPYTGPAILSGRASGVFFHEIFGHRIEGQRNKNENEGQTFARQVNQQILPKFISVVDDPTTEKIGTIDLNGHYTYDDEGIKARPVTVVENGVLKNFLLSRSPVAGFEESNGHGRKQPGYKAVGRQGNLIIKSSNSVPMEKLRQMLIDEAKNQGKQFGLLFDDISGGFTFTGSDSPQSFQVTPIMVYRIYVDGRPDELVRGADLIGTPLTSFSKIVAASDKVEVFNGVCGAESGYVPVSAVSPALLTTQIEVQKKAKSSERMPILPAPTAGSREVQK